ncbi:LexA family transcriptional regulator [Desulfohalovibrio reitneri]|uniref:LexA family transcriptional regulator n=1 Tax=Desulfohalovibrio reitneri TaxID=1307759 RepID=UPI0009DD8A5B|nr:S24 family peptidase [Desulfohalovibrio reitneri]
MVETSGRQDSTEAAAILDRLIQASPDGTTHSLATILGVTPQAVYKSKSQGKVPSSWIVDVGRATGVSLDWLCYGEKKRPEVGSEKPEVCKPDVVMVPKVRARLSAGGGSFETSADVVGRYAFKSPWIRSKGRPDQMVLMDVYGDSMEPEIKEGDTVLIDQSQSDVLAGGIYAIGIGEEVVVKFVDRWPGRFVLRSKNPEYPAVELDMEQLRDQIRIIGRVIWWCREAR